jgi:enoyl-CoA hydratase/carnithine racemase
LELGDSQGSIDLAWSDSVARIVINRPAKRNALSLAMWRTIPHVVTEINACPRASVVVVEGAGAEAFAAGADIGELEACMGSEERGAAYIEAVEQAEHAIASLGIPVVAVIRGFCIGAGLEIAMACDVRIATYDSIFAAPPAKLGANYSYASTRKLVELVGVAKAKDMLFTGRSLEATEAVRDGLVNDIASRNSIDEKVAQYVKCLLMNSPYSIKVAKMTVEEIRRGILTESARVRWFRVAGFLHDDFREGVTAFRERRKPSYR